MMFKVIMPIFLSGCAISKPIYPLKAEANAVVLTDYIKPEVRQELIEIDMVRCNLGRNWRSLKANQIACKNQIKNQAKSLGGNLVLLEPQLQASDILNLTSGAKNSVSMRGLVYLQRS